jgi:hypothetical protein
MKRFTILALFFLFITVPDSMEAKVSVDLKLDRSEATLVDSVRVVVSISGSRSSQSQPLIEGLEDFKVSRGGSSSRVEIVNGKVSAGIDYTYYIQPKKTGTFKIGPSEVKIDGKHYRSQHRTLTVVKPAESKDSENRALFLNAEISAKEVYVEEQATYTLKLFSRTNIKDISLSLPEHERLVFNQLGKPREYRGVYNGQSYEVLEVRYTIIPKNEGSYVIESAKMNMTVLEPGRRRRRSIFDDSFFNDPFFSFSSGRPITLASDSLELNVIPLPESGKPTNFSGLVGNFTIESQLEPASVTAGESATLTVRVKGQGNVQRIPDLKFTELKDVNIYADQPVLKIEQNEKGLRGVKTMKWALVPEKQGKIEVPPMMLSFFNPETKQYKTLESPSRILSVSRAEKESVIASTPAPRTKDRVGKSDKQEIKEVGRDILPIHTTMKNLTAQSRILTNRLFSSVILFGPLLLYMIAFFTLKLKKHKVEALTRTRAKKAGGEFAKQCRKGGVCYKELIDAVRGYLNSRFALSIGVLTPEEAAAILKSKGIKPDTVAKFRSIVQELENAVYTGKGHEETDKEVAKTLSDLIREIEKEIR